jgi:hypothetical protein
MLTESVYRKLKGFSMSDSRAPQLCGFKMLDEMMRET